METHRSLVAPGLGADEATRTVLAALADRPGLVVRPVAVGRLSVARTRRPRWAVVACVLTVWILGLGLLFLLVRRTEAADVLVVEGPRGAVVTIPPLLDGADARALDGALTGELPVEETEATAPDAADREPIEPSAPSHGGDLDAPTVRRPDRAPRVERPSESDDPEEWAQDRVG